MPKTPYSSTHFSIDRSPLKTYGTVAPRLAPKGGGATARTASGSKTFHLPYDCTLLTRLRQRVSSNRDLLIRAVKLLHLARSSLPG